MGQFRRLVFEYALKVKSKDQVFDEMLQLAQSAAGSAKLGDVSALRSLAGGAGVSGLGDVEALKGLVTQALKAAGPVLSSRRAGPSGGVAAPAGSTSHPAPPPVSTGRKGMPSVLGTTAATEAPAAAEPEPAPAAAERKPAGARAARRPRRGMPSGLGGRAPIPEAGPAPEEAPEPAPEPEPQKKPRAAPKPRPA